MSGLLTLPPEVSQDCIFPFLRWNDLLRLRRVSKAFKLLVQNYVRRNPKLTPEIWICGKNKERNLKAVLDMGLVSTKIYVQNEWSQSNFYQENAAELTRFLDLCGSVVTHLQVDFFALHVRGMERTFFEGLVNLQSFETEWFDTAENSNVDLPQVLGNITVLRLGAHGEGKRWVRYNNSVLNGFTELINHCKMLETLRPLCIYKSFNISLAPALIDLFIAVIQQRETNPENATLSKLKVIDFELNNYQIGRLNMQSTYLRFLGNCAKHGILLRGVGASGNECLKEFARNIGNLEMPLQSLYTESNNPYNWTWLMEADMPFLEKIILQTFKPAGRVGRRNNRVVCRNANWPKLKYLRLDVNVLSGKEGKGYSRMILQEKRELFRVLFEGSCYTALNKLSVQFEGKVGNDKLTAEQLTNSCPNLKKLTLDNWGGNNEQFVRLWEGLQNLEEVDLQHCSSLGDEGFIGPDAEKPVFLNLKKLRKLTLQSLSGMPGITDHFFISVVRHLSLTHFTIASTDPIKKVTAKGIESLVGGRFEEYIEKFPLHGWKLHSATPQHYRKFQKLFAHRLSNMM